MQSLSIERTAVTVQADIDFLIPGAVRQFSYGAEPAPGAEPASARFATQRVLIRDIRSHVPLSIAANGATLGHWPTAVKNFYDDGELRRRYYPEAAEIIGMALGADRVVVFDHNVRNGTAQQARPDRYPVGRPVRHAHTDYTERSAATRLQRELGAGAQTFAGARVVQVNLWRPIRGPLRDTPLAICDGATVAPHSLRVVELRYPDRSGEIYYLTHEPKQRWYFASDMAVDEAWLFKNFDSAPQAAARAAPHSAFADPRHLPVPPRQSIEVRAFALF